MTSLAAYALSLILSTFPPGRSPQSLERLPQCGNDPARAECAIAPVCPRDMSACGSPEGDEVCCAAPFWHQELGWVRTETRDAGAKRLEVVAQAIGDAALYHGASWREGPRDLVRFTISAGGWGMGFKEPMQTGRVRGPGGEVCLMDLLPSTLRGLVPWSEQRKSDAVLAESVIGFDYDSQRRCFDAGSLLIVRTRREAEKKCKGAPSWEYATFALYATGDKCTTAAMKNPRTGKLEDWLAGPRFDTLRKFRARKHTVFPAWYTPPTIDDSPVGRFRPLD